jgi:hypothetical protein
VPQGVQAHGLAVVAHCRELFGRLAHAPSKARGWHEGGDLIAAARESIVGKLGKRMASVPQPAAINRREAKVPQRGN